MKYFLVACCFIFSTVLSAQEMIVDWGQCFGSEYYHSGTDVVEVLPNDNIITSIPVGEDNEAYSNYHGGGDAWVIIFDNEGNIINEKCFGGGEADHFRDIVIYDESIYFVGQTLSTDGDVQSDPIGGYYNIWVVKTDFDLNIIWERQYGCLGTQSLKTAKVTPEGGLVFLMEFFNAGGGNVTNYYGMLDIWVCEIDANSEILWEKTLGNADANSASNLYLQEDGSCIVLGETISSGGMIDCNCHGDRDIWIAALDANTHDISWQGCYGGSNMDAISNIIQYKNGFLLAGVTQSSDGDISYNHGGLYDAWLLEIDSTGELIWEHCFGGSEADVFKNIYLMQDNNILIIGNSNSEDGDVNQTLCPWALCHANTWVVELDSNKKILWNAVYGPEGYDSPPQINSVKRIGQRDFVIAALLHETDNHSGDVDCEPYPVNIGESAWIFRLYDPNTTIDESPSTSALNLYPNPAKTEITFELPVSYKENILFIRDVFGQNTTTLTIAPSQQQLLWDCHLVPAGVYFYQAEIDEVMYMGKVVVIE